MSKLSLSGMEESKKPIALEKTLFAWTTMLRYNDAGSFQKMAEG